MKILVIGSTGGTGLEVVKQGIHKGHFITAFARHPEKLAGIDGISKIVKGDALNAIDIHEAVKGQDAVISVLGDSDPARNAILAMEKSMVRRGVWVTAYPLTATRPWLLMKFAWLMFGKHYRDMQITERILKDSDLDWTLVRPPRLTNGPGTGSVRVENGDNVSSGPYSISRADLAMVLLDIVISETSIRKGFAVTSKKSDSKKQSSLFTQSAKNVQ